MFNLGDDRKRRSADVFINLQRSRNCACVRLTVESALPKTRKFLSPSLWVMVPKLILSFRNKLENLINSALLNGLNHDTWGKQIWKTWSQESKKKKGEGESSMRKYKEDRDSPSGLTSTSVAEGGGSKEEDNVQRELKLKCPGEMKVKLWAVNGRRTVGNCTDNDKPAQQQRLL